MAAIKLAEVRPGRPRKFGRPSHAVTLTLPDDVIATLERVDRDLSHAVVQMAVPMTGDVSAQAPAELSKYRDNAVIVVKRISALDEIPGVALVPLPDGRALISLDESMDLSAFELRLRDKIEDDADLDPQERRALASVAQILKDARHTKGVTLIRRSIIVLQSGGRRRIAS